MRSMHSNSKRAFSPWSSATFFGRVMAVSGWAFVSLHHWRTPAALTAQSGIPRGMPLCCSNRTPHFPKGPRSRMNNKPKFSNEAGASGVSFTQPSRSDNTSRLV